VTQITPSLSAMTNENMFYSAPGGPPVPVVVWGSGNMGRAAVRAVTDNPDLRLVAVVVRDPELVGVDAGEVALLDRTLGVACTDDVDAALGGLGGAGAVAYTCSGELRPDDAVADMARALRAGAVVVSPSVYPLYDHRNAAPEVRAPIEEACREGGAAFFASGIDPGWGNDVLPVLATALAGRVDVLRCQEIFDYSTYDAPDSVRYIVGFGEPMDYEPPMVAAGIPSMVWGGQVRLVARALGVEVDELREVVERVPLEQDVTNAMGLFPAGSQGGLRFEVQGVVDGETRIVVEHITRIAAEVAPHWPQAPDGQSAHQVVVKGTPHLTISVSAVAEDGNRSAGGNQTAANRLVNAIGWLRTAEPRMYDGLEVPLSPGLGR